MHKVIFWDFHGTLIEDPIGWSGTFALLIDALQPELGMTKSRIAAELRTAYPWDVAHKPHRHTPDSWWQEVTAELEAGALRAGVRPEVAATAAGKMRTEIVDPSRMVVFPDTRPALELVRARGWRNVILSNHVPELPEMVERLGLADLVDRVFTSAAMGYEKPHVAIFRAALKELGGVDQAWMVGDNPLADIAGAQQAGLPAILVRRKEREHCLCSEGLVGAAELILGRG